MLSVVRCVLFALACVQYSLLQDLLRAVFVVAHVLHCFPELSSLLCSLLPVFTWISKNAVHVFCALHSAALVVTVVFCVLFVLGFVLDWP